MSDDKGPFEFPDNAPDPGLEEDPYGVSVEWDENADLTPSLTVPGGDLQLEQPSPSHTPSGTTPFDPENNPVDRSIWNANHPQEEVPLPYNPSDPLHLGRLPYEDLLGDPTGPTNNGPGDYPEPPSDPVTADNGYSADESAAWDTSG